MATNNKLELNSEELKDFLFYHIENNKKLVEAGRNPIAISISGGAGLGKTSVVEEVAKEVNMDFYKYSPQQNGDVSDITGYPVRSFKMCHDAVSKETKWIKNSAGKMEKTEVETTFSGDTCVWVDEAAIPQWVAKGYVNSGLKRQTYCPPEWVVDRTQPMILLIDDWTRAQDRFLQALMELILTQRYMDWGLPKGSMIILTENECESGKYNVNEIDNAMRTRMITSNMKFDIDCWARWAESAGIDSRFINFLLMNPEIMESNNDDINARSITMFFDSLASIKSFHDVNSLRMVKMNGIAIGQYVTNLFITFVNNNLDRLPSPKEMLNNNKKNINNKLEIAETMEQLVNQETYRSDIAMVLATRLMNYATVKTTELKKEQVKNLEEILLNENIFKPDIRIEVCKRCNSASVAKFRSMISNPKIQELMFPDLKF